MTDMKVRALKNMWQCGDKNHTNCWTSNHRSTGYVSEQAKLCHKDCTCWRHSISGMKGEK